MALRSGSTLGRSSSYKDSGGMPSRALCSKDDRIKEVFCIKLSKEEFTATHSNTILDFVFYEERFYCLRVMYRSEGEYFTNNCDVHNDYITGQEAANWWSDNISDCDPDHIEWIKVYYLG